MKLHQDGSPLHLPLTTIGFSDSFVQKAIRHGFHTLGELLGIPLTQLVHMEWFDAAMFQELSQVVKEHSIVSASME